MLSRKNKAFDRQKLQKYFGDKPIGYFSDATDQVPVKEGTQMVGSTLSSQV